MKIVFFGEFPPPAGGMAQQAENLAKCLQMEGLKVKICPRNISFKDFFFFLEKIRWLRTTAKLPIIYVRLLLGLRDCKVLHIFTNSYLNFYLYTCPAVILGKLLCKRIVIDYHGGEAENFFKRRFFWVMPFLKLADQIIVPSLFLSKIFGNRGIQTKIIPNIAQLEQFPFFLRKKLKPNFIVARHLEPEYGIDIILEAFALIAKALKEATLVILGDGSQKTALQQKAKDLGINEQVTFTGRVKNTEIPAYYSRADIFLNGSRVDNAPISIIEAFASGLPVLTTNAGGIPFLVKDRQNGMLVEINDSKEMCRKAFELLADHELAQKIALNARDQATFWSWSKVRTQILDVYQISCLRTNQTDTSS